MTRLPVLALPGLLCDERLWEHQAAALAPDHPLTTFPLVPQASMAELAIAALERAPADRFALLGLSMGGYLALEIVRRAPERVAALALLDTSAWPDTMEATAARRQAIAASATDFDGVVAALLPRPLHPAHLDDRAIVDVVTAMARAIGRDDYVHQQEAILARADSRPTLVQIRCPTLVLCGREDVLTPLALHEEMHAGITGSTLVVIERCGHLSTMERPDEVNVALRRWLAGAGA